jgi:hypothetical protein
MQKSLICAGVAGCSPTPHHHFAFTAQPPGTFQTISGRAGRAIVAFLDEGAPACLGANSGPSGLDRHKRLAAFDLLLRRKHGR